MPARDVARLDRTAILSLQRSAGNAAVNRLVVGKELRRLQRQTADAEGPREVCGAGEIGGQVYMCCHPNPYPHVPECGELHKRTFDECWETSSKDDRALEICSGKATFANCQCLERHRTGLCTCGGLV